MSATRPSVRAFLQATKGSVATAVSGVVGVASALRLLAELWLQPDAMFPKSRLPETVGWYCIMNTALTILMFNFESDLYRNHPRFEVYPRWSTCSSTISHSLVHGFCTIVLWQRIVVSFFGDGTPFSSNSSEMVTPVELHVMAGAIGIMLRDFIAFQMDWMFWAHHFVVVMMNVIIWQYAAAELWPLAAVVCGTMEFGSFGYDIFIMAGPEVDCNGAAATFYHFMMHLSHTLTLGGLVVVFLNPAVPHVLYWSLTPIMVAFVYLRHNSTGSQIAAEAARQGKAKKS